VLGVNVQGFFLKVSMLTAKKRRRFFLSSMPRLLESLTRGKPGNSRARTFLLIGDWKPRVWQPPYPSLKLAFAGLNIDVSVRSLNLSENWAPVRIPRQGNGCRAHMTEVMPLDDLSMTIAMDTTSRATYPAVL
jgi:hypothetical protein